MFSRWGCLLNQSWTVVVYLTSIINKIVSKGLSSSEIYRPMMLKSDLVYKFRFHFLHCLTYVETSPYKVTTTEVVSPELCTTTVKHIVVT